MQLKVYILMGFLGMNAWTDLCRRKVVLWSVGVLFLMGIIYQIIYMKQAEVLLWGIIPGAVLILASRLTEGALGMGDALVVLALGSVLGFSEGMMVLMTALVLAAIWAGILMIFCRKKKNYEFPFIPFLLLGYAGRWLLCIAGT